MNLHFRFAITSDANAVFSLIERAYRGAEAAKGWTNEAGLLEGPRTSLSEIESLIAEPDGGFLMALSADALVATAFLEREEGHGVYFGMFSVDPRIQAAGIGKALLAEAEQVARRDWSATRMRLTVISVRDDLIGWYERRGFRRTGRHLPFPFHEAAGALRTDFDLMELEKTLA